MAPAASPVRAAIVDGVGDSLALAREALQALPDDRRTQPRHLARARRRARRSCRGADGSCPIELRRPGRCAPARPPTWRARWPSERADDASADVLFWVEAVAAVDREPSPRRRAGRRGDRGAGAPAADASRSTARAMAIAMEFDFLLDPTASCSSIGYRVAEDSARPELLRPARLRGAARQLRRDRQGRRPGPPLVPARPRGDAGRARRGADLVVGLDVRVPDAVAGDARAAGSLLEQTNRLVVRGRSTTAPSAACRGASRNRPTTRATSSSPTSTRTSACPASASSAASARTSSSRPTRRRWPRWSIRRRRRANFARLAGDRRARPLRLLRGARLHAVAAARGPGRARSCAPTWRTTRA